MLTVTNININVFDIKTIVKVYTKITWLYNYFNAFNVLKEQIYTIEISSKIDENFTIHKLYLYDRI